MSALLTLRTLLVKVKKKIVNSENKENLSNYQLLKRKPSVCSTSLQFSKFITVVQFFSRNASVNSSGAHAPPPPRANPRALAFF